MIDLRREIEASLELDNPRYADFGEYYFGTSASLADDIQKHHSDANYEEKISIEDQLLDLLSLAVISERDLEVLVLAATLCGRLHMKNSASTAYRRLARGRFKRGGFPEEWLLGRLALLNLIASLADTEQGYVALSKLVRGLHLEIDELALAFQGYLRQFTLSFAVAVEKFVFDIGKQTDHVNWSEFWQSVAGALDLTAVASDLRYLTYDRFAEAEKVQTGQYAWVVHHLFGLASSPLQLLAPGEMSQDNTYSDKYRLQRRETPLTANRVYHVHEILMPDDEDGHMFEKRSFRLVLDDANANRITCELKSGEREGSEHVLAIVQSLSNLRTGTS